MKKIVGLALFSVAFLLLALKPADAIDDVVSALKSGNAAQLAKYFDTRVDISLPNKSDNFSRNQAEMMLKDFFTGSEVKNFVVRHKGENKGAQFCIGVLQTRAGNFRTKIYMKQKGSQQLVQEISFQAEE